MKHGHDKPMLRVARRLLALRIFSCAVLLMPVLGCETQAGVLVASGEDALLPNESAAPHRPIPNISLVDGSRLADIAEQLDQVAIVRSSALPEMQAAQAQLRALKFDQYPQIRPSASAPLTGGGASFGLNIEQLIWDGGRIRGRLTDAELKVATARLKAWEERNATVYDGLEAYLGIARYQARIAALAVLKQELDAIATLVNVRLNGGVADRGELLRVNTALQSVARQDVTNRYAMRQAQNDFLRLLPDARHTATLSDIRLATNQCSRSWPDSEAPARALARVSLLRTEAAEDVIRAQRFPKIVLSGGSNYSQGSWSNPAVGIRLDVSDMLGLGRGDSVEAAMASTRAAKASYALQQEETQADLARLEADYAGLQADATSLRALARSNVATLDLYKEQLDAGSIPLTEGIILQRERIDTLTSLIDVESDILLNCLRSSQRRGLLARLGATDGDN